MRKTKEQFIPLFLTVATFLALAILLFSFIHVLNFFPAREKIVPILRIADILVGLIIYLKTSIDFAIFIGNAMKENPGLKKRISIELGTALGNAFGTILILSIWNFFREIPLLTALMITVASVVLLRMGQESLEVFLAGPKTYSHLIHKPLSFLESQLELINKLFKPFLGRLLPNTTLTNVKPLSFWRLGVFSFTVPFLLGLDDFAGYIPLFNVVNVAGFAIGVFLGHMILNLGLFLSPTKTVAVVRNPIVLAIGGLAFVAISAWGFYEVFRIGTILLQ